MRVRNERVTIAEYAERTGQTESAVRAKVQRKTIAAVRLGGRVYIEVPRDEEPHNEPHNALAAKDAHIADLREQLQAEREARRRADVLLDRLTARIPALPEPSDVYASDAATVDEGQDSTTTPGSGAGDPRARPWYRRWFGW